MLLIKNKKALRSYEVIEKFTAGLVLKGYEVKALREKNGSFEGSYIRLIDEKPYLTGMHIGRYSKQSQDFDDKNTTRDRAILITKQEIRKLNHALDQKGQTAVPLAMILQNNLIKLEFATVKGLKGHQKKHIEKEKQIKKDLEKYNKETKRVSYS